MTELKLGILTEKGVENLATVNGDYCEIGRDPDNGGVVVRSDAVSSVHGVFIRKDNYWFFYDIGSTNGSKFNGQVLPADKTVPLKNGDIISLADVDIQVASSSKISGAALFIFFDNHLTKVQHFESNGIIKFGGIGSDFPVANSTSIILTIEFSPMGFFAKCFPGAVRINQKDAKDQALSDLDEVIVDRFRILVADPGQASRMRGTSQTITADTNSNSGYENTLILASEPQMVDIEFGKVGDTASIVKDSGIWSEQNKIMKRVESQSVFMQKKKQQNIHTTEDKMILFLGLILAVCVILILTWWLIT